MKVGTVRPEFRPDWMEKNLAWRILAGLEYLAAWPLYAFHTLALFRLTIEFGAIAALIVTVYGVYGEFLEREKDRAVRVATMFAQIAQTMALPEEKGLSAVKASVEVLARENVSMRGIDLSGAHLRNADLREADIGFANLSGADLLRANLSGANLSNTDLRNAHLFEADLRNVNLTGADLRNASLISANLSGTILNGVDFAGTFLFNADLSNADLSEADLTGTNLTGVDLRSAKELSKDQLDKACAEPGTPPQLPTSFTWNGPPCD